MEINLVAEGLKFMVLGMTVVLFFLVILVQVMKLQAKIIGKYFPEKAPEAVPASTDARQDTQHHVAAIVAAVAEFRKKHK